MNAIAMVHKMQRLALNSSSNMDVDSHKCTTIEEEAEGEVEPEQQGIALRGPLSCIIHMAVE